MVRHKGFFFEVRAGALPFIKGIKRSYMYRVALGPKGASKHTAKLWRQAVHRGGFSPAVEPND
jgi:hypothetical protein